MTDLLRKLCSFDATSGDEKSIRKFIIGEIKDFCEINVDNLGNIIALKKGKKASSKKLMIDAHMDEVGLIISSITDKGFLKFKTVGGIDTAVLLARKVLINGKISGVIGAKPTHLSKGDEAKKLPKKDSLYIDIGAKDKADAQKIVSLGDRAVICSDFNVCGDKIISKALDDRIGCAILIKLIKTQSEYDFYGVFSVQEEVGLRGAKVAAFSISPDSAIVLEGTTAADIADVAPEKKVCELGMGVAVSFMDGSTVYDRDYYQALMNSGLAVQSKAAVSGGNNSGAIHLSGEGVRTIALSVPCRYIHSASSVADIKDIEAALTSAKHLINEICSGRL